MEMLFILPWVSPPGKSRSVSCSRWQSIGWMRNRNQRRVRDGLLAAQEKLACDLPMLDAILAHEILEGLRERPKGKLELRVEQ